MSLPIVTIVGRPNVGKSSLFNAITRKRTSIVEPTAGVTRDRVSAVFDLDDIYLELVDTGGHGVVDCDDLSEHVEQQIRYAIDQAELILFVVDGREGVTPLDQKTAQLLRKHQHRVRLVANKVDEPHLEDQIGEFHRLGFGDPLCTSAHSGIGLRALRELIREHIEGVSTGETPDNPVMKVALVGKRNAGKSTFINALAGEDRVIVSEIPGTTRDSIDVRFEKDGRIILAIDTAGVRKKARIADDIEFYAYTRAVHSIRRADVVLFLIDSTTDFGQVDKRLAKTIFDEYKPCVLVINKWDLAKQHASTEDYGDYLGEVLPHVNWAPICFTTASAGRNIDPCIDLATELFKQSRTRVATGPLNQALQDALQENLPAPKRGKKRPKFFYVTQIATTPPTLVVFVNDPASITPQYERFLLNRLRERLPFDEVPIRLMFRSRREGHRFGSPVTT